MGWNDVLPERSDPLFCGMEKTENAGESAGIGVQIEAFAQIDIIMLPEIISIIIQ